MTKSVPHVLAILKRINFKNVISGFLHYFQREAVQGGKHAKWGAKGREKLFLGDGRRWQYREANKQSGGGKEKRN